jgi:hypothetical protein
MGIPSLVLFAAQRCSGYRGRLASSPTTQHSVLLTACVLPLGSPCPPDKSPVPPAACLSNSYSAFGAQCKALRGVIQGPGQLRLLLLLPYFWVVPLSMVSLHLHLPPPGDLCGRGRWQGRQGRLGVGHFLGGWQGEGEQHIVPPAHLGYIEVDIEALPIALHLPHPHLAGQVTGAGADALQGESAVQVLLRTIPDVIEGDLLSEQQKGGIKCARYQPLKCWPQGPSLTW